jgi:hypothetical protein
MTAVADRSTEAAAAAPAHPGRSRRADLAMLGVCVGAALYLTFGMWLDPNHRVIAHNQGDQALFEWLLSYAAHSPLHGGNPWWTTLLNHPVGANLAVNTSMVVVGGLLAPVTLTLGAPVSFLVVLTLNLILTPYAWYHVLSRHLVRTRAAAVLGGLFCGYAPGMVSHANGHLNFTAQYLVPFVVLGTLRLRSWRSGLVLGVLVALAYSIGAELLFFVALACAVFVLAWAVMNRPAARAAAPGFLRGLAVAAGTAWLLLLYPLAMQFTGPQRYHGIGFDQRVHSEDLAALGAIPYLSPGRFVGLWVRLAPNLSEETTFFGAPLLVLTVVCFVVLWRNRAVRALAVTALVFVLLALGPRLHAGGQWTTLMLPYAAVARLPVFDSALPARFALMLIPIVGLVLAFALDRALSLPSRRRRRWLVAFAVALVPVLPLSIPAAPRDPVPHFFSSGTWRQYVHSGQTLVPVPPASDLLPDGQRWQVAANFGFAIPAGFFLGPGPDGRSQIGPIQRPTYDLLEGAALYGYEPFVSDFTREQARADLAYWHARVVVLSDGGRGSRWTGNRELLLRITTDLLGPPKRVDDVWLWEMD